MMVSPAFSFAGNLTGSPAHILKLTRGLRGRGVDVSILQIDSHEQGDPDGEPCYSSALADTWWRVPAVLRKRRPRVLHCHGHKAALFMLPFAKALRVPLVCELHGLYVPS